LIVIALSDISLRWIEIPIRRGQLSNWIRGMKYRSKSVQRREKSWILIALIAILASTTGASFAALHQDANHPKIHSSSPVPMPTQSPTASATTNAPSGLWVTGDSIILGIREKLASDYPIALINARVGRQIGELIQVVKNDRTGLSDSPVIFDLGNNNHLTQEDVRTLFALLQNQPKMIVVDTAVPRSWRDDNNRIIRSVLVDFPQVRLVDWASLSQGHPEYFAPDGVHLSDLGGNVYVGAIIEALKQ
jgi:hypothetical protein